MGRAMYPPYQQPVLLCICLASVHNMLYVRMSSVQLYYVLSWSVEIKVRRYMCIGHIIIIIIIHMIRFL